MPNVHCVATLPILVPDGTDIRFHNDMEHVLLQTLEFLPETELELDQFGKVVPEVELVETGRYLSEIHQGGQDPKRHCRCCQHSKARVQPGFHAGFSDDPTSRALVALTNVMASVDVMQLFWALVGIEALFVSDRGGIQEQLREKIEALLGPREQFRKLIDGMYSIRSRLIHGAADIPAPVMAKPSQVWRRRLL